MSGGRGRRAMGSEEQPWKLDPGLRAVARTSRSDHADASPLGPRLLVEFIGTFFLVLTVCAAVNPTTGAGSLAPLAIGGMLIAMVFAGGPISGGHYNPAVSFAVMVRGGLPWWEWLTYSAIQVGAGAVGGVVAGSLLAESSPAPTADAWKVFVVELLFTFALSYVVLSVATSRASDGNSYFGLAIGATVAAGAFVAGGISGAAFNPAVALGGSFDGILDWGDYWIYLLAPLTAGAAAAAAFRYVQAE